MPAQALAEGQISELADVRASATVPVIDVAVSLSPEADGGGLLMDNADADAGIDVNHLSEMGSIAGEVSFDNNSNTSVRLARIESDATSLNSYFTGTSGNIASFKLGSYDELSWSPASGAKTVYELAASDAADPSAGMIVPLGGASSATLSLDVSGLSATSSAREAAKDPASARDLMSLTWVFEAAHLGSGKTEAENPNVTFYLTNKGNGGNETYSLAEVTAMAEDIAKNGEASIFYSMFGAFMQQDAAAAIEAQDTCAATTYECKVKWGGTFHDVRVIGINHDDLATPQDGRAKAGLTFQLKGAYKQNMKMYTTANPDVNWNDSELRGKLNGTASGFDIPSEQRSAFKQVIKRTSLKQDPGQQGTSIDSVFLLSLVEVFDDANQLGFNYMLTMEGSQYEYFQLLGLQKETDTSKNWQLVSRDLSNMGGSDSWWESLRSRYHTNTHPENFMRIGPTGGCSSINATRDHIIRPAFCL